MLTRYRDASEVLMDWKNVIVHANDGHPRGHALTIAKARELGHDVGANQPPSLHGALFRMDDHGLVPTQAASMDPDEFPNPHEIGYGPFPNRHLSFGLGPHRCLGIHLARRELADK